MKVFLTSLQKHEKILILITAILCFLFYWYEIRPTIIIKRCYFDKPSNNMSFQLPSFIKFVSASFGGSLESSEKSLNNIEYEILKQESCWHSYGLR